VEAGAEERGERKPGRNVLERTMEKLELESKKTTELKEGKREKDIKEWDCACEIWFKSTSKSGS
jgi:hypothetical protein